MRELLQISNNTFFFYYLASNCSYLALLIAALLSSRAHHQHLASLRLERMKSSPLTPPITLIAPAHNEEASVAVSVRSLLRVDYPELEVVVVNDGSEDRTLARLQEEFDLRPARLLYLSQIATAPVRGVYRSVADPRLIVVDKEAGGSKADASNAGLNAASSPYTCVVDCDSLLESDALLRIMVTILEDPKRVVAAGGIVRVLNGCELANGRIRRVRLPRSPIVIFQVIEYLRAFLIGREGWASGNMLTIISGAFGVFRRDVVMRVGGYRAEAIGEDFDLVARIHRKMLEEKQEYRITFVPDPVCWTEVPPTAHSLGLQRARWQKGLIDVLWPNRDMLFRRRYGRIGAFALPYMWVFELFAPVFEFLGIAMIILASVLGTLSHRFFIEFMIYGYLFAAMISVGAVLQEEITYRRYNDWRDVARLILYCFLEQCPYRQMHLIWRLKGMWQYARGDVVWRPMQRNGLESATPSREAHP
ncbi:MAG TPA: glycosyltransferase family 2 protein [Candidatus Limnocylindrales bacterium]|nr:glycosyltransferase family 2 protein [Candidatus Limnocylindrales bacterium]